MAASCALCWHADGQCSPGQRLSYAAPVTPRAPRGQIGQTLFPIPRGSRPAIMAWTTSGERKASERVIRIERSLQRSRTAIASVPAI